MTLTTPMKVIALAGLALVLGAGGVLMMVTRTSHKAAPIVVPPTVHHAAVKVVKVPAVHHAKPKPRVQLDPNLPAPIHQKLLLSRTLVAYAYTGASAADRALLVQVRKGAHEAGVPFVALNVTDEKLAESLYSWTSSSDDPAVLVVKRPGTILFRLSGPTDSQTVAQAAAAAR